MSNKNKINSKIKLGNSLKYLKKNSIYIVSLPERGIRSTVSLVTGVTSLITKSLIPAKLKNSLTYKFTFGLFQQFLMESIAEIKSEDKEFDLEENYIAKKTVGTIVEGMGLLAMNFSPLWLFAIISDVAGGSKVYFERLIFHLKSNKVIAEDSNYTNITELLDGIRKSSITAANAIDTPPISDKEFQAFKDSLSLEIKKNVTDTRELLNSIDELWVKMTTIKNKENITMNQLSGAMVLDLMKKSSIKSYGFVKATSSLSLEIFNTIIIKSYKSTLDDINKNGIKDYINLHMKPFIKQSNKHFHPKKQTLTEKYINYINAFIKSLY